MSSVMSPYLMSLSNRRSKRRSSRMTDPQPINTHNHDSDNMMEDNELVAKALLDGDNQGSYFHNAGSANQSQPFNNVANQIRGGRATNAGVVGYGSAPRAKIERRRGRR